MFFKKLKEEKARRIKEYQKKEELQIINSRKEKLYNNPIIMEWIGYFENVITDIIENKIFLYMAKHCDPYKDTQITKSWWINVSKTRVWLTEENDVVGKLINFFDYNMDKIEDDYLKMALADYISSTIAVNIKNKIEGDYYINGSSESGPQLDKNYYDGSKATSHLFFLTTIKRKDNLIKW